MKLSRSIARSLAALVLITTPVTALDPSRQISQYAHTAWRIEDGAFSGTPNAIAQSTDGYLWIGTDAGLMRFDGVRFVPWVPPDGRQMSIYSLLGGRDGSLWIGAATGLSRSKNGGITDYPNIRGRVNSILEDRAGAVWFARSRLRDKNGPVCRVLRDETRCFGEADKIPFPTASALAEDNAGGHLWIGSATGLSRWQPGASTSYLPKELRRFEGLAGVGGIALDRDGSVWVGFFNYGRALQQLVQNVWKLMPLPDVGGAHVEASSLLMDRDNALWVGTTSSGIFRVYKGKADHFGGAEGLSSDSVRGFYQDREGNLWVATARGIDRFHGLAVTSFSKRDGLTTDSVMSVLAAPSGTVWIGNRGGLDFLRNGTPDDTPGSLRAANGLPGQRVTALLEDHAGRLWVGVDGGLTIYERGRFRPVLRNGSPFGIVRSMIEDSDRNVWVRVAPRQLFRIVFSGPEWSVREELDAPPIPNGAIAPDPLGGIWLGGFGAGLFRYRAGKYEQMVANSGSDAVANVLADPDGSVWAATNRGLVLWKQGQLQTLDSKNGLPCDGIVAVLRDNQRALWLYAKCGIVAIADSELKRWRTEPQATLRVRTFDIFDGAQPSPTTFQPAASKSPDGRLWFANDTDLQMIDPNNLYENRLPPPVQMEQIVADRKNYLPRENLRLPALIRDLEIDYTALSFVVPQKVRFRYRLDGRDQSWQEPQTRRQAFYSDLPPGPYRFRVIASNNDGVWNEAGASWNFSIAPAYYQTAWFRVVSAGFFFSILWAIFRIRLRQIRAGISARFDERLDERTRLAREIHDTFLQTIQGSKMVAEVALDGPDDPVRMRRSLEKLSGWLTRGTEEGRAALNSLRISTTQKNDLADAFRRAGEDCLPTGALPTGAMTFGLSVQGTAKDMHPIIRDEVYRIGYEAIRNACLHSGASRLEVELSYAQDLVLRVLDNGKGIGADAAAAAGKDGHFGLKGMQERATRVRGRLFLSSSAGKGTRVELIVPGAVAFRDPNPVRRWPKQRD